MFGRKGTRYKGTSRGSNCMLYWADFQQPFLSYTSRQPKAVTSKALTPPTGLLRVILRARVYKHAASVTLMDNWPLTLQSSSQLSPIWSWIEAKINSEGCSNWSEFRSAVHKADSQVPLTMVANLYKSMPKMMRLVLETGGGKTGY